MDPPVVQRVHCEALDLQSDYIQVVTVKFDLECLLKLEASGFNFVPASVSVTPKHVSCVLFYNDSRLIQCFVFSWD